MRTEDDKGKNGGGGCTRKKKRQKLQGLFNDWFLVFGDFCSERERENKTVYAYSKGGGGAVINGVNFVGITDPMLFQGRQRHHTT
jgi:hypothetical protein